MSWEFYNCKDIKATKKEHTCMVCDRKIPIGQPAYNIAGKYEGEMQTDYTCMFCRNHEIGFNDDDFSSDCFTDWLREQDFMKCSNCNSEQRYDFDWGWDMPAENIVIECTECDQKWIVNIGWGEREGEK